MQVQIRTLSPKKLIGKRMKMSFADYKAPQLWGSFMPRRAEIVNTIGQELYDVHIYPPAFFDSYNPNTVFEKWAAREVSDFDHIPAEMECFVLEEGLYAVFVHKGLDTDVSTFDYIFSKWLPTSAYSLDDRPHFDVLGEKYKRASPESESEIWIPIKNKE